MSLLTGLGGYIGLGYNIGLPGYHGDNGLG